MTDLTGAADETAPPGGGRWPWLAGLLTILAPGVGHAYAGHPLRGAAFILLAIGLQVGFVVVLLYAPFEGWRLLGAVAAALVAYYVFSALDAARCARSAQPRRRNPWATLLSIVVAFVMAHGAQYAFAYVVTRQVMDIYKVPTRSMVPTILSGDRIMMDRLAYRNADPARGDIVVYRYPTDRSRDFVKRVVGLPGDRVEAREGLVRVNGVSVDEPYLVEPTGDFEPRVVPAGSLFVLGDHRGVSNDSRIPSHGFVPRDDVRGRVVRVIWPSGEEGHGLDWNRLATHPR